MRWFDECLAICNVLNTAESVESLQCVYSHTRWIWVVWVTYNNELSKTLITYSYPFRLFRIKGNKEKILLTHYSLREFKFLNKDNTYLREVKGHHDVERERALGQLPDLLLMSFISDLTHWSCLLLFFCHFFSLITLF